MVNFSYQLILCDFTGNALKCNAWGCILI